MTVYDNCYPLGFGTTHLPVSGLNDLEGIENSANLILNALDRKVNYIDVGWHYSNCTAETVLKKVFERTDKNYYVTVKSELSIDKNRDGAIRRVEKSLETMGIDHASFFMAWTIRSFSEFEGIMKNGGLYEGAQRLKDQKIIDHICFSTHAPANDIIKILNTKAFSGVTISYSLLNSNSMHDVLDAAKENNIGVAIMNPLGGGIIPQNKELFDFARYDESEDTVTAALRYVKAHPAVKIVLSGMSNREQLDQNLKTFSSDNKEKDIDRYTRVNKSLTNISGFCTGCKYCEGCPKGIPTSVFMQCYNETLFNPVPSYNRTDKELLTNINMFAKMWKVFGYIPTDSSNPCIGCKKCERNCTQHLKISQVVDDVYKRVQKSGYSIAARKQRLSEILANKGYKKVGFYPNGGFVNEVLSLYKEFFGNPDFEVLQFNSNPNVWNTKSCDYPVYSPDKIEELHPDIIISCSYKFGDEIAKSLLKYEKLGIKIITLHNKNDIPWVF